MKKVLVAFDGEHFSSGVIEFIRQMNAHEPILAVGVFLPPVDYIELLYSYGGIPAGPLYFNEAVSVNEELVQKNIARFREQCKQCGIEYRIHADATKHIVNQLKEETRFADLLVLSSKSFYENTGVDNQEDYIVNVSHKAECPVVLISEDYSEPKSIIMAYDGSEQAVYAIKQFSYLFHYYAGLKALLVFFANKNKEIPNREVVEELLTCYYKDITITKLNIAHKADIEEWMLTNNNPIVVAGAFGRPMISEFFKKSFTLDIIRSHKLPVFITHK